MRVNDRKDSSALNPSDQKVISIDGDHSVLLLENCSVMFLHCHVTKRKPYCPSQAMVGAISVPPTVGQYCLGCGFAG